MIVIVNGEAIDTLRQEAVSFHRGSVQTDQSGCDFFGCPSSEKLRSRALDKKRR